MPSVFPGMDPHLESPRHWLDFHGRFITHLCEELNERLPRRYSATSEERVPLVHEEVDESVMSLRPDISIMRTATFSQRPAGGAGDAAIAVLEREPIILPHAPLPMIEEEATRYVRIVQYPDNALVAVLELLSPWNKGEGRNEYLTHRMEALRHKIHLIELDLLVAGRRLPMAAPLPRGDYYAFVTRSDHWPDCEVYAWGIREPLPVLRIPLVAPDADLLLNLQPIFTRVFDRGRCADRIDYAEPLRLPLQEADREWAKERSLAARID